MKNINCSSTAWNKPIREAALIALVQEAAGEIEPLKQEISTLEATDSL
jgi:hypothetical protein